MALFPEGDLYRQAEPRAFGPGIGFLAARSGAPVIPVGITGAERIWDGRRVHRPRVELAAGPAIRFDGVVAAGDGDSGRRGRDAYARFADAARAAVLELRNGGPRR